MSLENLWTSRQSFLCRINKQTNKQTTVEMLSRFWHHRNLPSTSRRAHSFDPSRTRSPGLCSLPASSTATGCSTSNNQNVKFSLEADVRLCLCVCIRPQPSGSPAGGFDRSGGASTPYARTKVSTGPKNSSLASVYM